MGPLALPELVGLPLEAPPPPLELPLDDEELLPLEEDPPPPPPPQHCPYTFAAYAIDARYAIAIHSPTRIFSSCQKTRLAILQQ